LYGFALERNPYNSVDVTVSIGPPKTWRRNKNASDNTTATDTTNDILDPLAEEKSAFLDGVGRKNTVDFPCYADRYPTEMLEYLRLMMMTPEDTRGRNLSDFDYTRTISAANEASVLFRLSMQSSHSYRNIHKRKKRMQPLLKIEPCFNSYPIINAWQYDIVERKNVC